MQLYARELANSGARVSVFTLHYPYSKEPYIWNGIAVFPLNGSNSAIKRTFVLKSSLKRSFGKLHRAFPVDVIHSFWLNETTIWGRALSSEFGIPHLASAMGQDVLPENMYLKHIERHLPDTVVTLSLFQKEQLIRTAGIQSHIIPFGIDPVMFTEAEKTIDVIGVGNLIPLKRFDYFLEICSRLKEEQPQCVIRIIGSGTEQPRLQGQIRKAGLAETVQLSGQLSYPETLQLIAKSKVLLHTSRFEGFGMILIEALHARTHVLASPVGMAYENEMIHVLVQEVETDVAKLIELLREPLPQRVTYAISDTVNKYEEVYHSGLKNRNT